MAFFDEDGGVSDIANLRKREFYKCLEKAKRRKIRLHLLRHTYATLRIQAGHKIADVSRPLGHYSIRITIDTDYPMMPGSNAPEVDELDRKNAPKRTLSTPSPKNTTKKGAADER